MAFFCNEAGGLGIEALLELAQLEAVLVIGAMRFIGFQLSGLQKFL
jgi:hypothetical protein